MQRSLTLVALLSTGALSGACGTVSAEIVPEPPLPPAVESRVDNLASPACPPEMVLVEGRYCPDVEQPCKRWMDPKGRYEHFRCAEYGESVCRSARKAMRFCIDRTEHAAPGDALPRNFVSFADGQEICRAVGKRLCKESEWQFACEGEDMLPYPYGHRRDATACNTDVTENLGRIGRLVDHRTAPGEKAACRSPFGVMDLAGNLEEWVEADDPARKGAREVMKGSWWIPSRHACRSFQIGHGARYGGGETGVRCCKGL